MTQCIENQDEDEFNSSNENTCNKDKENTHVKKSDYSEYFEYAGEAAAIVVIGGCAVMAAPVVWGLLPVGVAAVATTAAVGAGTKVLVDAVVQEVVDGHICIKCVGEQCGISSECDDHHHY